MDTSKDVTATFEEMAIQLTQDDVNFLVGKMENKERKTFIMAIKSAL